MKYFNGFSLQGEEALFSSYLIEGEYCVAGFSYGAQQALEYVHNSKVRIDRLILLSPAFFQNRKPSYGHGQLHYFEVGEEVYIKQFLKKVSRPSKTDLSKYLKTGTKETLESLLTYIWDKKKIEEICNRGTTIEVFLGKDDRIIDAEEAFNFFEPLTTTYFIKSVGHLLSV